MDLGEISRGLRPGEQGIWIPVSAATAPTISFPVQGHAECIQIEDSSFWFNHRNRCILEAVRRFPPGGSLVELGAGNGFVALALERAGFTCVALEPGHEGARNARRRGVSTVACATLEAAGFVSGSLSAIGAFDVVEHIDQDEAFLREAVRTLVPGGRFYVTVPALRWLWSAEDEEAGHFRRYTLSRLKRDLTAVGLRIEYGTFLFAPLVFPVFLFRTLPFLMRRPDRPYPSRAAAQHVPHRSMATGILDRLLSFEFSWLRSKRSLPFGTSCLVVARKP